MSTIKCIWSNKEYDSSGNEHDSNLELHIDNVTWDDIWKHTDVRVRILQKHSNFVRTTTHIPSVSIYGSNMYIRLREHNIAIVLKMTVVPEEKWLIVDISKVSADGGLEDIHIFKTVLKDIPLQIVMPSKSYACRLF